jgi:DDE superfamily endonuclease
MEEALAVYQRPRDPSCPRVGLDEATKQLSKETRPPLPLTPGQPARCEYAYERNGTATLFMMFAPREGWRHVNVTERHPAVDYAQALTELADIHCPPAQTIVLVQDNLTTPKAASLYEAFPPAEARRLVERVEWPYTPTHGSWLDRAESELSVVSSQGLDRRLPDRQILKTKVAAGEADRNQNNSKTDWQFTTDNARLKLNHLYPINLVESGH